MMHTVIVPTLALKERGDSLRRAIASARAGNQAAIEFVVVVNGNRFDPALLGELQQLPGVRVLRREQPGSHGAIFEGRKAVRTPFFSYLDDDDEYLPGAVDRKLAEFAREASVDVVASNGIRRRGGRDERALKGLADVSADPLAALFRENWLPSCGVAFRTATVAVAQFEDLPRHIHWSFLAFRLSMAGCKVATIDEPGFVINDTPGSASKSDTYLMCHVEVYARMLAAMPPEPIRQIVLRRHASALHEASDHFRAQGRWREAWHWHLRSLRNRHGWQYLSYTRRLLWPSPPGAQSKTNRQEP